MLLGYVLYIRAYCSLQIFVQNKGFAVKIVCKQLVEVYHFTKEKLGHKVGW